eukprot:3734359-Pyramimonas_sp.AAC.1
MSGLVSSRSVSSAYTSSLTKWGSSTCGTRCRKMECASVSEVVKTIVNIKGDNGHPWHIPKCWLRSADVVPESDTTKHRDR